MSVGAVSGSSYFQLQQALAAQQAASQQTSVAQVARQSPPGTQNAPVAVQGHGHHDHHSTQFAAAPGAGSGSGATGNGSAAGNAPASLNAVA
jgi:hypothetical protein